MAELDTRGRLGKVDGRFPHWVTPYTTGTRYSLIYYVTSGEVEPQTTAIFSPIRNQEHENGDEEGSPSADDGTPWIAPPVFVP